MNFVIENAYLVDPKSGQEGKHTLYFAENILAWDVPPPGFIPDQVIDAKGLVLIPGLIDLAARLREPGEEHKASIASESFAAVANGITTLCLPPDTQPVLDNPAIAEMIEERARKVALAEIFPLGALTVDLAGEQLSAMGKLKAAGCLGMSQGLLPIANSEVLKRALLYASTFDLPVFLSPQDAFLSQGCMHEGAVAARLGLPVIAETAETIALARDLLLVEETGARVHFGRLSSAKALKMLLSAQAQGLAISGDTALHHLFLTEQDVDGFNRACHLRPPLRSQADREALRRAFADGLIAVCSDHQPQDADAKARPFPETEPGLSALDTVVPLLLRLKEELHLSWRETFRSFTALPAAILGLADRGHLQPGGRADLVLLDPQVDFILDPHAKHPDASGKKWRSQSRISPFAGFHLQGLVRYTWVKGKLVYRQ
jgi:dihydroorotase